MGAWTLLCPVLNQAEIISASWLLLSADLNPLIDSGIEVIEVKRQVYLSVQSPLGTFLMLIKLNVLLNTRETSSGHTWNKFEIIKRKVPLSTLFIPNTIYQSPGQFSKLVGFI